MRKPPSGTVARGMLREDARYYAGRTEDGEYVEQMPVPVTRALLERGQERYDIFCTVCHGGSGDGNGIIMAGNYGYTPAPTYHSERLRDVTDGYIYDVITNGVRNMTGYAQQIPVADRWAIVAYVRALQRSQNADAADVPQSVLSGTPSGSSAGAGGQATGDQD
jgi:mono/diheme cytochrome c family protein